jgi:large subunit ribosomal protein L1
VGKTKTAFVSGVPQDAGISGEEKYKLRAKKKAEAQAKEDAKKQKASDTKTSKSKEKKQKKIKIAGLKGGQRIAVVTPEEPIVEEKKEEEEKIKKQKRVRFRGKKYTQSKTKVDTGRLYPIKEAVKLVKESSYTRFDGSVELHLIVKKKGLTATLELPYSGGKAKRIEVADDKTIEKLKKGATNFDVLLATAEMMPKLVPFARLLGPKGLMPNPKLGTLIKSPKDAEKFKGNRINIKTEKEAPLIHTVVGKVSQKDEELVANIQAVLDAIGPRQIEKGYASATMGPSVKIKI